MKLLKKMLLQVNSPPKNKKSKQLLTIKSIYNMKTNKIIIILSIFISFNSFAQLTKGNWLIGGNASFSYSKSKLINNTNTEGTTLNYTENGVYLITLQPNIGYFIKNKFAIGTKLDYINSLGENFKLSNDGMNLNIGLFLRYYFLKYDNNYNILIEPSYSHFFSKGLGDSKSFGLKSGLVIFLNSSVGIESTINYIYSNNSNYEFNNVFIGLGMQVHLEKK